jgi:hypothetical protein
MVASNFLRKGWPRNGSKGEEHMSDRFDLEQAILRADMDGDLNLLFERVCNGPPISEDDMANALLGLITINALRHEKLWNIFEDMCNKRLFKDKYEKVD